MNEHAIEYIVHRSNALYNRGLIIINVACIRRAITISMIMVLTVYRSVELLVASSRGIQVNIADVVVLLSMARELTSSIRSGLLPRVSLNNVLLVIYLERRCID